MGDVGPPPCLGCSQPMSGKFVNALGGYWHLACFCCPICNEMVASKFFPIDGKPYCERDYYTEKGLLCQVCLEPIKGPLVTINEKKWHADHFKCTLCETLLQSLGGCTYFEHEGLPYCSLHYSALYASKCAGCEVAIIDQFVEEEGEEKWHVDCYKLSKIWNLKLPPKEKNILPDDLELLGKVQDETKLRVTTTFVILWNLEEEIAQAISELIITYDVGDLATCHRKAALVTRYSEEIFEAVNKLLKCGYEKKYHVTQDEERILTEASDILCHAIEASFQHIAKTAETKKAELNTPSGVEDESESKVTSDFVRLVMKVAQGFKEMIGKIVEIAHKMDVESSGGVLDVVLFELRLPSKQQDITEYEPVRQVKIEKQRSKGVQIESPPPPRRLVFLHEDGQPSLVSSGLRKTQSTQIFEASRDAETEGLRQRVRQSLTAHLSQFFEDDFDLWKEEAAIREHDRDSDPEAEAQAQDGEGPDIKSPKKFRSHLDSDATVSSLQLDRQRDRGTKERIRFIAELSSLELLLAKQLAATRLAAILQDYYSHQDISSLIQTNKPTDILSKIFGMVKKKKKIDYACFGQPLYIAAEKTGVESLHGSSFGALKIPRVVEQCMTSIVNNGISTTGIFRKAGQEGRVATLKEEFSKKPGLINMTDGYKPHDVSTLLKRFLREMPEPLLTFPLYKLFLLSQYFEDEAIQTEIIHLTTLLLPKCNRDLLEVLSTFFRKLSDHAEGRDETEGNLMTSDNLATVLAPTVMYAEKEKDSHKDAMNYQRKGPQPLKRTSSQMTISRLDQHEEENEKTVKVVKSLIENAYNFAKVPQSILEQLHRPSIYIRS